MIRELEPGMLLEVLASDPSTSRDIPKFCLFLGHELLESGQEGELYRYKIRKQG
ncbi:MAG TPA: preprotein translocase subunit TatC [Pseudomonadaceae bacterium]|nr:preprotein translocase subunit TatC [Pseudomonadaceae bacterium]